MWAEGTRVIAQAFFLGVWITAAVSPLAGILREVIRWTFVTATGGFTINSLLARHSRKKLNEIIEA